MSNSALTSAFLAPQIDPFDHYWQRDNGDLFASAKSGMATALDPDFLAWAARNTASGGTGRPSIWPRDPITGQQTMVTLQAVLVQWGLYASLDSRKAALKAEIDAKAEALRSALITPGSGQAMEYQEAQAQASAALAAPQGASAALYPMLAASIGLDLDPETGAPATDVLGVARAIRVAFEGWLAAGAAIRRARLLGKAAVDAAETLPEALDAAAAIVWPRLA
ncbi:hypothetical protein [Methylobacterium sp. CCH5-D2]|uniref:hypothetical protein n=1 Tax=Methylobacterium sp. CCH5-D2 TaxID=1768765 RepID=UPI0008318D28|nr:hypothetical protein [Methylobacterium sp. CCH5-D2]